jgi:competence protein ComEC
MLASLLLAAVAGAAAAPRSLDVYWIDVEGGAATLIVTPAGESLLVDTGYPGERDAARIHQVAAEAGLKSLDHVVITHLHRDHFGGLADLTGRIPVGTVWASPVEAAPAKERAQPEVEAYLKAKVGRRSNVRAGDEIPLKPAAGAAPLRLRILGARQDLLTPEAFRPNDAVCRDFAERPMDQTDNANSIGFVLEMGRFRFFDGGDLTWNVEARLVCPFDRVGPIDVYQTDHHGLDSSNNPVLVKSLAPTVAIFNNGPRKGGESGSHADLAAAGVQAVYQLHRNVREGAVNTDPARIANLEEACTGSHVRLTVAPDGESYTVRVPSREHQAAYTTRPR